MKGEQTCLSQQRKWPKTAASEESNEIAALYIGEGVDLVPARQLAKAVPRERKEELGG